MGSGTTDHLYALLQDPSAGAEGNVKVALSRVANEVKRRLTSGSANAYDFLSATTKALAKIRGSYHAEIRLACLYDCATYFFANRHDVEALECARQLEILARQCGNERWLRKGIMFKGIAYAHLGDWGEAVLQLTKALALARDMRDVEGQASVMINVGIALNYAGLYREAIPCFVEAIELAQRHPELSSYSTGALCNLAQSNLYLGSFEEGMAAISRCLAQAPEPSNAMACCTRAIRELTFVQLALELGKTSAAREHAKLCGEYARRSGLSKAEFQSQIAYGLCEVHGGDANRGLATLERALDTSGDEGSSEYADALVALVHAYDETYQPEKALEKISVLLNKLRASRERGIAALIAAEMESLVVPQSAQRDLQAFALREAELRAMVAERSIAQSRIEMFERLAVAADVKEEASGEHGYRVGRLALLVAEKLKWANEDRSTLELAARLHDLGKIAMPDRILLTTKKLQEAERHFMSKHTTIGAELLGKSNIPQLRMAEEIARYHHEWWNGEGYPSKLKGKRIPIHARIVALADVFDALTHGRPFAASWSIDEALSEIRARKGTQFDPDLTDVFLELIERLRTEHEDLDEYLGRAGKASPFLQARAKIRQMLAEEREHEKMATVAGNETRH